MAIIIKTEHEIELMRKAGEILAKTHEELKKIIKPGISTYEIDKCGEDFIRSCGCEPSFLNIRAIRRPSVSQSMMRLYTAYRLKNGFCRKAIS